MTEDSDSYQESTSAFLLPEYDIGNGVRIKPYLQLGLWVAGTRGDVAHFRVKHVIEGKVEKEILVPHFVIRHHQLISKNWIVHVGKHFRVIDWNQFIPIYNCALELIGYEMGDDMQFCKL